MAAGNVTNVGRFTGLQRVNAKMFSRVARVRREVSPPVIRFRSLGFPLGCVAESVTSVSMEANEDGKVEGKVEKFHQRREKERQRERKRKVKEAARWKSIP